VFILAASGGHRFVETAKALSPLATSVVVTQTRHPKAVPAERLAETLLAEGFGIAAVTTNAADAVTAARRLAGPDDLIVATGSLFVAAEVTEVVLGIEPELYSDLPGVSPRAFHAGVTI
jgi:dihydrofolate synthase/folylpolyglutamate synthase